jgi:hypothetical protein
VTAVGEEVAAAVVVSAVVSVEAVVAATTKAPAARVVRPTDGKAVPAVGVWRRPQGIMRGEVGVGEGGRSMVGTKAGVGGDMEEGMGRVRGEAAAGNPTTRGRVRRRVLVVVVAIVEIIIVRIIIVKVVVAIVVVVVAVVAMSRGTEEGGLSVPPMGRRYGRG